MGWFGKNKLFDNNGKVIKRKGLKVGIAFGGGGTRGIGHIGVIKAFEELGISADFVSGTSAGSMVGALYCAGYSSSQMMEIIKKLRVKDIKNSKFIWKPSSSENIEQVLNKIFGKDLVFSELEIPLSVVAVNVKDGEEVHITSGSVARASAGSCAVPGIFTPIVYNDMHLVDGGLRNTVPADVVRHMGADIVFAIEVNRSRGQGTDSLKIIDVLKGSLGIIMQANVENKLEFADLVLKPNLESYKSSKLGDIEAMIQAGYDAVMSHKQEIIRLVTTKPKKKVKSLWTKLRKLREKNERSGGYDIGKERIQ